MTRHRLPWQLVIGLLLVVAGVTVLVVALTQRHRSSTRAPVARSDGTTTPPATTSPHGFGEVAVRVTDAQERTRAWCLLAARNESQRERGLMQVRDRTLGGHDGMAFLFEDDVQGSFWMRNTPLPLSIAYIDRAGGLVSVADMAPCGDSSACPSYRPAGTYRTAIEVPRGGLAKLGIGPGSLTRVGGPCAGRP